MIGAIVLLAAALATPSVAETERAFAAAAQTMGQWASFRVYMAPHAIMLVPKLVQADAFLAGRKEPAVPVRWAPDRTVTSCDGSLAFSTGPWQREQGTGRFFTIWQRQPDGAWKWVYDGGTSDPLGSPAHVATSTRELKADCGSAPVAARQPPIAGGEAKDGTLRWRIEPGPVGDGNLLSIEYVVAGKWVTATSTIL